MWCVDYMQYLIRFASIQYVWRRNLELEVSQDVFHKVVCNTGDSCTPTATELSTDGATKYAAITASLVA